MSIDPSSHPPPRILQPRRLFVSNISQAVSEFNLLRLFSPFGSISKLDFLFHLNGPQKGRPRGFAFIEFATEAQATKARLLTNGKRVDGRTIVVENAWTGAEEEIQLVLNEKKITTASTDATSATTITTTTHSFPNKIMKPHGSSSARNSAAIRDEGIKQVR